MHIPSFYLINKSAIFTFFKYYFILSRTKPKTSENFVWANEKHNTESSRKKQNGKASKNTSVSKANYSEQITLLPTTISDQLSTDSTHSNYCELLNCNFEGL